MIVTKFGYFSNKIYYPVSGIVYFVMLCELIGSGLARLLAAILDAKYNPNDDCEDDKDN